MLEELVEDLGKEKSAKKICQGWSFCPWHCSYLRQPPIFQGLNQISCYWPEKEVEDVHCGVNVAKPCFSNEIHFLGHQNPLRVTRRVGQELSAIYRLNTGVLCSI